eukprot:IDg1783t1
MHLLIASLSLVPSSHLIHHHCAHKMTEPFETRLARNAATLYAAIVEHALRLRDAQQIPSWPPSAGMLCAADGLGLHAGEVAARLPCGHALHAHCIFPYLRMNSQRFCPIDGTPVPATLAATRLQVARASQPPSPPQSRTIAQTPLALMQLLMSALSDAELTIEQAAMPADVPRIESAVTVRRASILENRTQHVGSRESEAQSSQPALVFTSIRARTFKCDIHEAEPVVTLHCDHDACAECSLLARCAVCGSQCDAPPAPYCKSRECARMEISIACAELGVSFLERRLPYADRCHIRSVLRT